MAVPDNFQSEGPGRWSEGGSRRQHGPDRQIRRAPPRRQTLGDGRHRERLPPSSEERALPRRPRETRLLPGTVEAPASDPNRKVKVAVVAIAFVLFIAIFPFWLSAMIDDDGGGAGETFVVDRFMDNSTRVLVNSTFLGSDVSFKVPADADIQTAKLTLSGALPPQRTSFPVGRNPTWVDVGDVDGDLFPDAVVANYKDDTVIYMRNTGSELVRDRVISVGKGPIRVLLKDLDDDDLPDLLVLSEDAREFRVLLNDQIGGFRTIGDPYNFDSLPADLAAIDFDHDGDLDAAVITTNNDNLTLFRNDGTGTLTFHSNFTTEGNPTRLGVVDYDLDGYDDLIVSNRRDIVTMDGGKHEVYNTEKERYYQWLSTVSFWSNNGQGEFHRKIEDLRVEKGVSSIDCGDINGDGYPDIIMANLGYHDVSIMESDGSGGFYEGSPSDMDAIKLESMDPIQARLRDIDLDGDLDIIAATKSADSILVYIGNGRGDFEPYVQNYVGLNPTSFQFIDYDSDGDMDIITSDWK
ncbi:MAG: FG-GAP repeat domain-containing protein, partial [Thermoplasmatota archaeon]